MNYYGKAQDVGNAIIAAFVAGTVPQALAKIFIKCAGRHCDNYSWSNRLLVALAGYSDAMGYGSKDKTSGWLSVGRRVRKGEKATLILAPCFYEIEDPKTESGKRRVLRGFRAVPVFGLEQTEVEDVALWAKHNKGNADAERFLATLPFREVADAWGYRLGAYSGEGADAYGWHMRGEAIALGVENLATWAHELMHAADYKNGKLVERGQHWRSETVAQLGACILMYAMGYETEADLGGTMDYIKHYADTARIDPIRACMDVLNRTCEAVSLILEESKRVTGSVTDANGNEVPSDDTTDEVSTSDTPEVTDDGTQYSVAEAAA